MNPVTVTPAGGVLPALTAQELKMQPNQNAPDIVAVLRLGPERIAMASFAARVNTFGPLSQASPELRSRVLEEVEAVAQCVDGSTEVGLDSGYARRVLHDDPAGWSLAAIILRSGQATEMHDHDGWGCAVTVQGVERDRRFVRDASGRLVRTGERDYLPGQGYLFDPSDIHQPAGADPQRVTVALHFLSGTALSEKPAGFR